MAHQQTARERPANSGREQTALAHQQTAESRARLRELLELFGTGGGAWVKQLIEGFESTPTQQVSDLHLD